jgi:hypothetical protein
VKQEIANVASRTEPDDRTFDLAVRFKSGNKKGTAAVVADGAKGFTHSLLNIFRLNMFDQVAPTKAKLRGRSAKQPLSKTTTKKNDRLKKLKRMTGRRREEHKKKKAWQDYVERLAKGKLVKGEKPPA